ncbi:uncharacterized protein EI97DRAFT_458599 [Westerdykella ornata]|uniref:Uncharacterized protein n=1 Tax=Westerdykella ornata TaxID=318751 RepID=A0A6A6JME3_WESOR|nr:uncharacterized protein EI97DRAFT_458599 [Westerdykella ornata]KAF2276099.1 hypothetical protein EI97DRAFT_458599 [Westerdykella ornata]
MPESADDRHFWLNLSLARELGLSTDGDWAAIGQIIFPAATDGNGSPKAIEATVLHPTQTKRNRWDLEPDDAPSASGRTNVRPPIFNDASPSDEVWGRRIPGIEPEIRKIDPNRGLKKLKRKLFREMHIQDELTRVRMRCLDDATTKTVVMSSYARVVPKPSSFVGQVKVHLKSTQSSDTIPSDWSYGRMEVPYPQPPLP